MQTITAFTKEDFRKWLKKNHDKESKVGVIVFRKHTGKPFPYHKELMEEAICFGWIDTTLKRIDDEKYIRHFSRRTSKSKWSNNTLKYGKELIEQKRMTPAGLKAYHEGLKRLPHDHGIPENPEMPEELKKVLERNKKAKSNFEKFTPSVKKMVYRWILRAKMKQTKAKRVKIIVEKAKANDRDVFG